MIGFDHTDGALQLAGQKQVLFT